jgi:RND family efflux transporter MFP subunit
LALGGFLLFRSEARVNKVALSESAKPVAVVQAKASTFRPSRTYIGTFQSWVEAQIGPQIVSAYVDTVLVRPGAVVKHGEVLATLDCRNTNAASQAVAAEAHAVDARLRAISDESARYQNLMDGGFAAANEAEQKQAQSKAQEAELMATKAKLLGTSIEVGDCVLRSPFDGEVATRTIDPGAFVRPGVSIVSVVDRKTVRLVGDAPEMDFSAIPPGTLVKIRVIATDKEMTGTITRRAPAADPGTRTVHFEIDLADPNRDIPVGTTGEIRIDVGQPVPATEIPLFAASVRGPKASVFVVENGVARMKTFGVKGEIGGSLFVDPALVAGTHVVSEGRAILSEGDRVAEKLAEEASPPAPPAPSGSAVRL